MKFRPDADPRVILMAICKLVLHARGIERMSWIVCVGLGQNDARVQQRMRGHPQKSGIQTRPAHTVNGTARLVGKCCIETAHRSKRIALCPPLAPHTRAIVRNLIVACIQRTMQPA